MTSHEKAAETDTARIRVDCSAQRLFAFMADPANLVLWSFGTWRTDIADDGLVHGRSIFDGASIYLRIAADAENGIIDFHIGPDPGQLVRRIFAQVLLADAPDPDSSDQADLLLIALRTEGMDEDRWDGLKVSHAFEVRLIKRLIESGFDHRRM